MSTKENDNIGCGKVIAIIGVIGSLIAIFTFLTGIVSIRDFGRPPQQPTVVIVRETVPPAIQPTQVQASPISNEPPSPSILPANPEPTPTDVVMVSIQKPNTPSNKILNVGETWVKDGFGVTLTKVEPGIPGTRFHFIFENTTQSNIYFEFDTGRITVTDNNGTVFPHSRKCKTPVDLATGKTDFWITTYCPGGDEFQTDFYDSSIQYFIVAINNIGRIDKAVWQVSK